MKKATASHFPIDLMDSPSFFAKWFQGSTWATWRTFLRSLSGRPLSAEERTVYQNCTGRSYAPTGTAWSLFREVYAICGRGAGKSIISAMLAVSQAVRAIVEKLTDRLGPGEVLTVMVVASELRQARVVFRFIQGFVDATPLLKKRVTRQTQSAIEFVDRLVIEVHVASFRSTRGYSILCAIFDELAFFPNAENAANQDVEILNAVRPGLARVPGSLLIAISSPWGRRGALWTAYDRYFGKDDGRVLVWQADSLMMNPTLDPAAIEAAYAEDAAVAAAEWGAQFRRDIENFVSREVVEQCRIAGRYELPPIADLRVRYLAFVDPSGGSSDSMTLAIAHADRSGQSVLDLVREVKPPFSPETVVREFASLLKPYRCSRVTGDRYSGEWVREAFRKAGVHYSISEQTKSEIYLEALPLLNSGRVELLDHPRLTAQLLGLERRTARGGKDSIDHGPRQHDDVVNAAAGAVVLATTAAKTTRSVGRLAARDASVLASRLRLQRLIDEKGQRVEDGGARATTIYQLRNDE